MRQRDLFARFRMTDAHPVKTPMVPNIHLSRSIKISEKGGMKISYLELMRVLTYLAAMTRPGIGLILSYLEEFNNCSKQVHCQAAKRVLQYFKKSHN